MKTFIEDIPIQVEAIPGFGYKFVGWTDESLGTQKIFDLKLKQDIELIPIFEPYIKENE